MKQNNNRNYYHTYNILYIYIIYSSSRPATLVIADLPSAFFLNQSLPELRFLNQSQGAETGRSI